MEACTHGPFRHDDYEIRIAADFSKETNDRRKAFLALRPRLRQLEVMMLYMLRKAKLYPTAKDAPLFLLLLI
ncbi:hypothetical protein NDU88_010317 [Pleurodeles waltl]|uniref:Uncharacterized protein n=1 Tax=Pleurodeles waltl TaxID=8319 RepID=A0AAV7S0Z8_PLEWA|nr:hypothetical protein NDU88_010317 [Pleurodeles waltl]